MAVKSEYCAYLPTNSDSKFTLETVILNNKEFTPERPIWDKPTDGVAVVTK